MNKNMNIPVVDWKGDAIVVASKNENGEVVEKEQIVGDIVASLLFSMCDNSQTQMSGEEKLQAYRIAQKIGKDMGAVELSAEDIVLLKKVLCPILSVGAYGQIVELLEG